MYAERKELQSTKSKDKEKEEEIDSFSIRDELNVWVNHIYYSIVDSNETITGYLDLTEHFPKCSSRGNQYIMVSYYYNANHIRAVPIKNRRKQTITKAWEELHSTTAKARAALQIYILDNEK